MESPMGCHSILNKTDTVYFQSYCRWSTRATRAASSAVPLEANLDEEEDDTDMVVMLFQKVDKSSEKVKAFKRYDLPCVCCCHRTLFQAIQNTWFILEAERANKIDVQFAERNLHAGENCWSQSLEHKLIYNQRGGGAGVDGEEDQDWPHQTGY